MKDLLRFLKESEAMELGLTTEEYKKFLRRTFTIERHDPKADIIHGRMEVKGWRQAERELASYMRGYGDGYVYKVIEKATGRVVRTAGGTWC